MSVEAHGPPKLDGEKPDGQFGSLPSPFVQGWLQAIPPEAADDASKSVYSLLYVFRSLFWESYVPGKGSGWHVAN